MDPTNEDTILDLCAAPGNKTLHMAKYANKVYANEINEKRFELLKKNIINKKNIVAINCDATSKNMLDFELKDLKFDKILVDAPCSGWGVFRSKPEMKIYQSNQEVLDIIKVQKKILKIKNGFIYTMN